MLDSLKIGIYREGGIGDLILMMPAIKEFRKRYPDKIIGLFCKDAYKFLYKNNPYVDWVKGQIVSDEDWIESLSKLDVLFDLSGVTNGTDEGQKIDAVEYFGKKLYLDSLRDKVPKLSIEGDSLFVPKDSKDYVVIGMETSSLLRRWSFKRWEITMNLLIEKGYNIVLVGQNFTEGTLPVVNLIGKLNLMQLLGVIKHSKMVLASDTGLLHIAGALEVPFVGLFGPIKPEYRVQHYKNYEVLIADGLKCLGCDERGESCHRPEPECMQKIMPDSVVNKVELLMERLYGKGNSEVVGRYANVE